MSALALIDNLISYIDDAAGSDKVRVTKATQAALRNEIESLIATKKCAPILVRLAW